MLGSPDAQALAGFYERLLGWDRVDDLGSGVAWAIECGATLAELQPQDDVRVMLDPGGHPFCLFDGRSEPRCR